MVIYCFSLVKATMNAARVCKLHNGVNKMPQFLLFLIVPYSALVNCGGVEFLKLR
jgi:hypothetical protein